MISLECYIHQYDVLLIVILQILLDDVKVLEQLLDLVFYLLIILGGYRQVLLDSHL